MSALRHSNGLWSFQNLCTEWDGRDFDRWCLNAASKKHSGLSADISNFLSILYEKYPDDGSRTWMEVGSTVLMKSINFSPCQTCNDWFFKDGIFIHYSQDRGPSFLTESMSEEWQFEEIFELIRVNHGEDRSDWARSIVDAYRLGLL